MKVRLKEGWGSSLKGDVVDMAINYTLSLYAFYDLNGQIWNITMNDFEEIESKEESSESLRKIFGQDMKTIEFK